MSPTITSTGSDAQSDQINHRFAPACGAYINLNTLVGHRLSAKDIKLVPQKKALSHLAGPNSTRFRGRGIDFSEVRAYQAGDDIRSIDWRVTARSGKTHTKVYQEERERPVMIAVDQSQSMFFGSRNCFKSVLAGELAAYIAWAALANGDRIGGSVFGHSGSDDHHEIKPKRSHHAVLKLLQTIHTSNRQLSAKNALLRADASQAFTSHCKQLNRICKPGSAVFVISDFFSLDQEALKYLFQLSRHNDVSCIFTYDAMEAELPPAGLYQISDGKNKHQLDTADKQARQHYLQHFEQRKEWLAEQLGKMGIRFLSVATHQSPLAQLQHFFGARQHGHQNKPEHKHGQNHKYTQTGSAQDKGVS
jgi:uncharacterized protein (DUF58 family)